MSTHPPLIRADALAANRISDLIMFTGTRLSSIFSEILSSQFNLGINEWRILSITITLKECTIGDICGEAGVHKTVVSRTGRELEKRGLVHIQRRGRYVRVSATEMGEQLFVMVLPIVRQLEEQLTNRIDTDAQRGLVGTLQQLSLNLRSLPLVSCPANNWH